MQFEHMFADHTCIGASPSVICVFCNTCGKFETKQIKFTSEACRFKKTHCWINMTSYFTMSIAPVDLYDLQFVR